MTQLSCQIGNILSTHATAETTRILQRTAVSPQRQSPRRRSARMDTTLRKKVAIQNVMKDATEGPTPRSLIQAVVAQGEFSFASLWNLGGKVILTFVDLKVISTISF